MTDENATFEYERFLNPEAVITDIEVHPVKANYNPEEDMTWCEQCEPHEADFWSIYARYQPDDAKHIGGAECLGDYPSEHEAIQAANQAAHKLIRKEP